MLGDFMHEALFSERQLLSPDFFSTFRSRKVQKLFTRATVIIKRTDRLLPYKSIKMPQKLQGKLVGCFVSFDR